MDAYDIVDWRRRVFALYAEVRAIADPAAGHDLWRRSRDELLATHPASPLLPETREGFSGLPVPDYDPAWRFEVEVLDAEPATIEVASGTDGHVPFERLGRVEVPEVGSLDVWRLATYGGGLFVPVKDASAGKPGGTYGGGRYVARHRQGRRPRRRRPARLSGARPELRLQPVLRLRPGLGLPARAAGQHRPGRDPGRRARVALSPGRAADRGSPGHAGHPVPTWSDRRSSRSSARAGRPRGGDPGRDRTRA